MNRILLIVAVVVLLAAIPAGAWAMPDAGNDSAAAGDESVVNASNRFAADLYLELANDSEYADRNIFFSPASIVSAFGIAYEGAREETADEIRSVFYLPENDTARREGFSGLSANNESENASYTLHTANALWAEETYPFLPAYIDLAQRYYSANLTNLDFIGQPEESREEINLWVENETKGRITDLLTPGSIDASTLLVITNAIYFKGLWDMPFDKNLTSEEPFRTGANESARAFLMHMNDSEVEFGYAETADLQVLEIPYESGEDAGLSMLILLPVDENLTAAEMALYPENLSGLQRSLAYREVDVYLPKFRMDTEYGLAETLGAMGMPTAFSASEADFSGMDGTDTLFISEVVHKAFVEVDEEGTEAAASTGIIMPSSFLLPEPEPVPVFRADHPFVFLIQDRETGAVLFVGRVVNPETP